MKGRVLVSPKGLDIRPSSDRVREAIFSIIGQDLSGVKVLDLFAGTGSQGLEALSRGALRAVFIDNSQGSINLIKKNIALCRYQDSGAVLKTDLDKGIPGGHSLLKDLFDLVFIDPPYRKNFLPFLLKELSIKNVLSSGSRVVAESSKKEILPDFCGNLVMFDSRLYGDTKITIYANKAKQ